MLSINSLDEKIFLCRVTSWRAAVAMRKKKNEPQEPLVHTVDEAAALLRLSRQSTYEAVRRGEIPTIQIGKRILVPRRALLRMIEGAD